MVVNAIWQARIGKKLYNYHYKRTKLDKKPFLLTFDVRQPDFRS